MAMKNLSLIALVVAACISIATALPRGVDPAAAAADPFFDPSVAGMDGINVPTTSATGAGAAANGAGAAAHGAAAPAATPAGGATTPAAAPTGGESGPAAAPAEGEATTTTPGGSTSTPAAPANASPATFPAMGTLVGASLLTFIAYYLH